MSSAAATLTVLWVAALWGDVTADFTTAQLRGPFIRRHGITNCTQNLAFATSQLNISAEQVVSISYPCQTGRMVISRALPTDSFPGSEFPSYMAATRGVGTVLVGRVTEPLMCDDVSFDERAVFTFIRTNDNVTVDLADAFRRNDTLLQRVVGRPQFIFSTGIATLVVNSLCLYTEVTTLEFNAQRTEACFPTGAELRRVDGVGRTIRTRVQDVRTGDRVVAARGGLSSPVIGWTHRDATVVSQFVELVLAAGIHLTLSPRHYLYADGRLAPARTVRAGQRLRLVGGGNGTVVDVRSVWRLGLYNLQTEVGDVVVDGVVCSTYTEFLPAVTAHSLLLPFRFLARLGVDGLELSRLFHNYDAVGAR